MKILCIADIHGYADGIVLVRNYIVNNDIGTVVLMGDYSVGFKDPRQNLSDINYALEVLQRDASVWGMPGNCDQPEVVEILKEHKANLHLNTVEIGGVRFVGMGGSNPTPFQTPIEFTEEEIYGKFSGLIGSTNGNTILITHFPPKDTICDIVPGGEHVGSVSLRRIIEDKKPLGVICSHIHESGGKVDHIGDTKIVNVGMLDKGNAVLVDTSEKRIEHIKIIER